MRRALLTLAILLTACDEPSGDTGADHDACLAAFDCVVAECEYPAAELDALGDMPDCDGLEGSDFDQCWSDWTDAKNEATRPFGECLGSCRGPMAKTPQNAPIDAGVDDAAACVTPPGAPGSQHEAPDACDAPSCDAF